MHEIVKINYHTFDSLIDAGSTTTLICESVYQILGRLSLNSAKIRLIALGKGQIQPLGSFKATNEIEDTAFQTGIWVIDDSNLNLYVIIGADIVKQGEFFFNAESIELISKLKHVLDKILTVNDVAMLHRSRNNDH